MGVGSGMRVRTPQYRSGAIGFGALAIVGLSLVCVVAATTAGATAAPGDDPRIDHVREAQASDQPALSATLNVSDADTAIRGSANDSFGKSLATVGDVNGDGYTDLLVGAPFNDSAGARAGGAYLFFGPVTAEGLNASDADLVLLGESAGDWAGWSVAAGDVNGDGLSDLIVGAPLNDRGGRGTGAVYVIYGDAELDNQMSLGDADEILIGEAPRDNAGHSVAAGDVTGGPAEEIVVGAPRSDAGGTDSGAVYVADDLQPSTTQSLAGVQWRLAGVAAGDMAGSSVDIAGDFDGDGGADVVVGARNASPTGAGAAFVVTRTGVMDTESLANATLRLNGAAARDHAGWAVAGAGDTNGDGRDDVVVGAPHNDAGGHDAGAAYVVHGSPTVNGTMTLSAADRTLNGTQNGAQAGWSVAGTGSGDVTCDGVADVLVGAPRFDGVGSDSGAGYLISGASSPANTTSLADATARFSGGSTEALTGWAVAGGADLTGDGRGDFLVSAPGVEYSGHHDGGAYLTAGDCRPSDDESENATSGTEVGIEYVTACMAAGADEALTGTQVSAAVEAENGNGTPTTVAWQLEANGSLDGIVVKRTDGTFERFPGGQAGTASVGNGTMVDRNDRWACAPAAGSAGELTLERLTWTDTGFERRIGDGPTGASATVVDCKTVEVETQREARAYWVELTLVNRSGSAATERHATVGEAGMRVQPAPGLTGDQTITMVDAGYDPEGWVVTSVAVRSGSDWLDTHENRTYATDSMGAEERRDCVNGTEKTTTQEPTTETATGAASGSGEDGGNRLPADPLLVVPVGLGIAASAGLLFRELG